VGTVARTHAAGNGQWGWSHNDLGRAAIGSVALYFWKIFGPGRLVNKFAILVIDFVTALFNLGVKKTAGLMIKYPRIKKNAQQFLHPVPPISECLK
jgi:hypothetical protein